MGGPRASTERMRASGKMCCFCNELLSAPYPGRERTCDPCSASKGMHQITLHIQRHGWSVTLSRRIGERRFRVGPWLIFENELGIQELLRRGRVLSDGGYADTMRAWGVATVEMELSAEQYIRLLEAGIRDPRNGYDKLKAKERR